MKSLTLSTVLMLAIYTSPVAVQDTKNSIVVAYPIGEFARIIERTPPKGRVVKVSYYGGEKGRDFHGKTMKNGEKFNKFDPTIAASVDLPLGTIIEVTNPDNGKVQRLTIKDTGDFKKYGRKLDVSLAAAEKLGFKSDGVALLEMRVISTPPKSDG